MTGTTVLDAHALLWFLEGDSRLSPEGRRRIADPAARLLIPAIAVAEACWAIQKGKSRLTIDAVRHAVTTDARITVIPVDAEIVFAAAALPGDLEMHDRLIAATTARERSADPSTVLLTIDGPLRGSNVVPTVW